MVITWTDRATTGLGTGVALRIAAAFEIPVLNLATVSPRAACERLRDIALKPTPFVPGS